MYKVTFWPQHNVHWEIIITACMVSGITQHFVKRERMPYKVTKQMRCGFKVGFGLHDKNYQMYDEIK